MAEKPKKPAGRRKSEAQPKIVTLLKAHPRGEDPTREELNKRIKNRKSTFLVR
jgi:hypothetical protein